MNDEINKSTYNSLRKHIGLPEVNRNEIKEILDWLKDEDIYIEDYGYQYKRISLKETNQLLDYITNLQQEYESLKDYYMGMVKIASKRLDRYLDYKVRIEKAIEYIDKQKKKMYKSRNKIAMFILMKLENILQNGSDE